MTTPTLSRAGIAHSLIASILFGMTTWYVQLTGLTGSILFWNRILFTAIALAVILFCLDRFASFRQIFLSRRNITLLSLGGLFSGFQWWLFVWAPVNGQTQALSLGYFLLPLTLTLTGKLVFHEQLRTAQKVAIPCALVGVLSALIQQGSLPWVSLGVAGLYPIYFIIRRRVSVDTLPALLFEHLLYVPAALWIMASDGDFTQQLSSTPSLWYLLPGLGIICCGSLISYISASRKLPVTLFGLLGYLEPALIFGIAVLVLREPFSPSQWLTYGCIWLAAAIVSVDSARLLKAQQA